MNWWGIFAAEAWSSVSEMFAHEHSTGLSVILARGCAGARISAGVFMHWTTVLIEFQGLFPSPKVREREVENSWKIRGRLCKACKETYRIHYGKKQHAAAWPACGSSITRRVFGHNAIKKLYQPLSPTLSKPVWTLSEKNMTKKKGGKTCRPGN